MQTKNKKLNHNFFGLTLAVTLDCFSTLTQYVNTVTVHSRSHCIDHVKNLV